MFSTLGTFPSKRWLSNSTTLPVSFSASCLLPFLTESNALKIALVILDSSKLTVLLSRFVTLEILIKTVP
jgi:hypothetical protein